MRIELSRPYVGQRALEAFMEAMESDHHSGDGPFSRRASEWLMDRTGAQAALLTPSGTDALELALMLADVGPGDEVIVPSFTFPSAATAVLRCGARVRFADVDEGSLGMTASTIDRAASPRTRAVINVPYAGIVESPSEIASLCRSRGWIHIEDSAHALGGAWLGEPLAAAGRYAALSFHATKNLSCGEGGALLLHEEADIERAECLREKGTNRKSFIRGEVSKYQWVAPGSSFLLSDISAAVLWAAMCDFDETQRNRSASWDEYQSRLETFSDQTGFRRPIVDPSCQHPAHIYYLLAPSKSSRDALVKHLRQAGIGATSHFEPLLSSSYGALVRLPDQEDCPVSEAVASRIIRLPLHAFLTARDLDDVVRGLYSWVPSS